MTAPTDEDAYAKFRADLAATDVPTDVAVIAYRFAHQDLTKLADEEEALIQANSDPGGCSKRMNRETRGFRHTPLLNSRCGNLIPHPGDQLS